MAFFNFSSPTLVTFGQDAIAEIGRLASKYGKRALIVTNQRALGETGIIDSAENALKKERINDMLFGEITSESDSEAADVAANMAIYGKADVIIGIGGFSTLNMAKAAATVARNGGEASDYLISQNANERNFEHLNQQMLFNTSMPLILVPTIVGTGAEITNGYYLTDKYDGVKKQVFSDLIYSTDCVIDPKLNLTVPSKYLVTSALMIFASAFEVFIGAHVNAISDSLAVRAMELVVQNIKNVVEDQSNLEYRQNISMASMLCSLAINSSRLGPLRAVSLAAESIVGVYPGVVTTILLPHIMDYNITAATNKFIQIVKLFGEDTSEMSVIEASIKSAELIRRFLSTFNLPVRLSEVDVSPKHFEIIAERSMMFDEAQNSPRSMSQGEIQTLLEQAH